MVKLNDISPFNSLHLPLQHFNFSPSWVLKCDVRQFFASIDHQVLQNMLVDEFGEKENGIHWLLGQVIDSFHTDASIGKGLPLGNLTSQLLANVYMNKFDHYVKRALAVKYYIRYADDFVILHRNKAYLQNLVPHISDFLERELKLELHPNKLFIKTLASGVDFLGWVHFPTHRVLRTTTKRRMLRKIQQRINSADGLQVKQSLASYEGMLIHGNAYHLRTFLKNISGKDIPS